MKDTGTIIVKDTSQFIQENPTNELRWAWKSKGVFERYLELQQKWEISIFKAGILVEVQIEWRDVPEVDETESTPTK